MDVWPKNNPETLEHLTIQYCVNNLETFTQRMHYGKTAKIKYCLLPGVSLPKTICDKILEDYTNQLDKEISDSILNIFSEPERSQLSRLILTKSIVSDKGLKLVEKQPIIKLGLSDCNNLTARCISSINKMSRTLQTLILDGTPDLIGWDDSDSSEDEGPIQMLKLLPLKCRHLRKLVMRNCPQNLPYSGEFARVLLSFQEASPGLNHLDLTDSKVLTTTVKTFRRWTNLSHLSLAGVDISQQCFKYLRRLTQLKHLDISQSNESLPVMFVDASKLLKELVDSLTLLVSLDISGTNLPGFEKTEQQSFRPGEKRKEREPECSIPGLEGRSFEFLGLMGCAYNACGRNNIPAKLVTGEETEDQIILSMQVYQDRASMLTTALNNLFPLFRTSIVHRQCATLEAILNGMKRHPGNRHVQISGSASLFYIVKGEKKNKITQNQRRRIIDLTLQAMDTYHSEGTMIRNGCLTLCHFNIPQDVMYCYEKLVRILLEMLKRDHLDPFIHHIGIFLLNCMACQGDGREKEMVGRLGAIETMLRIITNRLINEECDDVMEIAWSTMWNVTDETPANCEMFMKLGGMKLFLQCLKKFEDKAELLRNMMGLMGNISEVKELRPRLMVPRYIQVFSDLLDSTSDGIEVSYNAAGVLAHLASDSASSWAVSKPSRNQVLARMVDAICRWDIKSRRNINYRSFEPILRLMSVFETPEVQHWAVWALCNLTAFCPEKYCLLLEKEHGTEVLRKILDDPRPYHMIRRLAYLVLLHMKDAGICFDFEVNDYEPKVSGESWDAEKALQDMKDARQAAEASMEENGIVGEEGDVEEEGVAVLMEEEADIWIDEDDSDNEDNRDFVWNMMIGAGADEESNEAEEEEESNEEDEESESDENSVCSDSSEVHRVRVVGLDELTDSEEDGSVDMERSDEDGSVNVLPSGEDLAVNMLLPEDDRAGNMLLPGEDQEVNMLPPGEDQAVNMLPPADYEAVNMLPSGEDRSVNVLPSGEERAVNLLNSGQECPVNMFHSREERPVNMLHSGDDRAVNMLPSGENRSLNVFPSGADRSVNMFPSGADRAVNMLPSGADRSLNMQRAGDKRTGNMDQSGAAKTLNKAQSTQTTTADRTVNMEMSGAFKDRTIDNETDRTVDIGQERTVDIGEDSDSGGEGCSHHPLSQVVKTFRMDEFKGQHEGSCSGSGDCLTDRK